METRTSATARIVAVIALIGAVIAVVVVLSTATNSSNSSSSHHKQQHQAQKEKKKHRTTAKTYTVETGDTLTSIAHKTGVPLSEIMTLNPGVDPQILTAGEVLKLK